MFSFSDLWPVLFFRKDREMIQKYEGEVTNKKTLAHHVCVLSDLWPALTVFQEGASDNSGA